MYKIIFGLTNGEVNVFDDISEIHTGKDISNLKAVDKNEILTYAFNTKNVYQLIGKNSNIIYYSANVDYMYVRKTSD